MDWITTRILLKHYDIAARLIASCLGIGFIRKGGGTVVSLLYCILWVVTPLNAQSILIQVVAILFIFFTGILVSQMVEPYWGKDNNKIVIDEISGMSVSLFLITFNWVNVVAAFLLFRFFDIAKPLYIRKAEIYSKGWGVMLDDLMAGIYTNIILHVLIFFKLLQV